MIGWLVVIVILAAIDLGITHWFVPRVLVPRYGGSDVVLRDRTAGNNLGVLFTLAKRRIAGATASVVLVGDSTIMGHLASADDLLSLQLDHALRARQSDPPTVIDFGFIGLPVTEATIAIAKALGAGADIVAYAMTPRIMCQQDTAATDAARYALDPDVVPQLGFRYLWDTFAVGTLATSGVQTRWHLLAFRRELRAGLARQLGARLPEAWAAALTPRPYTPPALFEASPTGVPLWTRARCAFEAEGANGRALARIVAMCATARRCLLYAGPVNPEGVASFEAGLVEDFVALVARTADAHGVAFRDWSHALPPASFGEPRFGRPDAIHPAAAGQAALAALLAREVTATLTRGRAD